MDSDYYYFKIGLAEWIKKKFEIIALNYNLWYCICRKKHIFIKKSCILSFADT